LKPEVPRLGFAQVRIDDVAAVEARAAVVPATVAEIAFEFVGADVTRATTVIESEVVVPAGSVNVTGILEALPDANVGNVPNVIEDGAAAEAGATEVKTPNPKAATVTSAMRLKVVFVDICFLSISRVQEFPNLGLNQISLVRFDESHVLIHQIPHRVSGRGEETYLFVCHLHSLR